MLKTIVCVQCQKEYTFKVFPSTESRKLCSRQCSYLFQSGKKMPDETKNKIREARFRKMRTAEGIKQLEEAKVKMINKLKGRRLSPGTEFKKGDMGHWKGGRTIQGGYVLIYCPDHPFKIQNKYVLEHRLIMEKHLGRFLQPNEVIHHINGNKLDNRIENLMYFENESAHQRFHHSYSIKT